MKAPMRRAVNASLMRRGLGGFELRKKVKLSKAPPMAMRTPPNIRLMYPDVLFHFCSSPGLVSILIEGFKFFLL
jgi:hypothetical protein